jgi:hypothetical protein
VVNSREGTLTDQFEHPIPHCLEFVGQLGGSLYELGSWRPSSEFKKVHVPAYIIITSAEAAVIENVWPAIATVVLETKLG